MKIKIERRPQQKKKKNLRHLGKKEKMCPQHTDSSLVGVKYFSSSKLKDQISQRGECLGGKPTLGVTPPRMHSLKLGIYHTCC